MKYTFYFMGVSVLDWYSTITYHDYTEEETPLVREVWRIYGDIGLTIFDLLVMIFTTSIFIWAYNYCKNLRWLLVSCFFLITTFKFLVALTNLGYLPFWILSWY